MAQLLSEIDWGNPLLPPAMDADWEAEIKRRGGRVGEVDRRVAPSPWLREVCIALTTYRPTEMSLRLYTIGAVVTAQENSCRYCYGANRAFLKILGYSERHIVRIEREAQVAELDDRERGVVAFCRNLARSRPRPAKADRDKLVALGFAPLTVQELAFAIAMGCFYNRVAVFLACPPEQDFERFANGMVGRLVGMTAPLMRLMEFGRRAKRPDETIDAEALSAGPFGAVVAALVGLGVAGSFKSALESAFASPVLSRGTKALMFAIVARTLGCGRCEHEACKLLLAEGFEAAAIDSAMATLTSNRIPRDEVPLLSWVRDTVHYQTADIQDKTRALTIDIGPTAALEAIGIAAMANATVRLATLLE